MEYGGQNEETCCHLFFLCILSVPCRLTVCFSFPHTRKSIDFCGQIMNVSSPLLEKKCRQKFGVTKEQKFLFFYLKEKKNKCGESWREMRCVTSFPKDTPTWCWPPRSDCAKPKSSIYGSTGLSYVQFQSTTQNIWGGGRKRMVSLEKLKKKVSALLSGWKFSLAKCNCQDLLDLWNNLFWTYEGEIQMLDQKCKTKCFRKQTAYQTKEHIPNVEHGGRKMVIWESQWWMVIWCSHPTAAPCGRWLDAELLCKL